MEKERENSGDGEVTIVDREMENSGEGEGE